MKPKKDEMWCRVCCRSWSQLEAIGQYRTIPYCINYGAHDFTGDVPPAVTLANIDGPLGLQ